MRQGFDGRSVVRGAWVGDGVLELIISLSREERSK